MSRRRFWLPLSLFVALSPSASPASETFPNAIKGAVPISGAAPNCTLCHTTEVGGPGMITTPFGKRVYDYGLRGGDTGALTSIIDKMRDMKDDSDRDGTSDIDELKAGTDPNINDTTGLPPEDYPPPVYGCQSSRAGDASPAAPWALAAAGFLVASWLRSRMPYRKLAEARLTGSRLRKRAIFEKGRGR
jgi:hypothetical protein